MRKKICLILVILLCIIGSSVFMACENQTPAKVKAIYSATMGGYIDGETNQTVNKGANATTVVAVADEGYTFLKWSDEVYEAERTDKKLNSDLGVTAIFEKGKYLRVSYVADTGGSIEGLSEQYVSAGEWGKRITAVPSDEYIFVKWSDEKTDPDRKDQITESVTYTAYFEKIGNKYTYEYNNATENADEKSVVIRYNCDFKYFNLPVPQRTNSTFEGWYLDKDFTTQVSDENGKIIMKKNTLLASESTEFYAKFTNIKDVTFKVLMAFATEVNGTFHGKNGEQIQVDYVMPELHKDAVKELCTRVENTLNEFFAGWVNFVIDPYFTTKPLSTYDLCYNHPENIYIISKTFPELREKDLNEYRMVFNIMSLDEEAMLQGHYSEIDIEADINYYKFFNLDLAGIVSQMKLHKLKDKEDLNSIDWDLAIAWVLYDFADAIDSQNYSMSYKDCSKYLSYLFESGKYPYIGYVFNNLDGYKEYLTNHIPKPENKYELSYTGIPYEFWMQPREYEVTFDASAGGKVEGNLNQTIAIGNDAQPVRAVPDEGYRFVKWSTGETDVELTVENVRNNETITAIFEKIK